MSDDLTVLGNDDIRRSFDEHYGTMMDVEQDPTGAMWAIQKQADRIEELEAKLRRVVAVGVRVRDYFTHHSNDDVYAVHDFDEAIAYLKGQNDE